MLKAARCLKSSTCMPSAMKLLRHGAPLLVDLLETLIKMVLYFGSVG
jgi:hypothetical protein